MGTGTGGAGTGTRRGGPGGGVQRSLLRSQSSFPPSSPREEHVAAPATMMGSRGTLVLSQANENHSTEDGHAGKKFSPSIHEQRGRWGQEALIPIWDPKGGPASG